MQRESPSTNCSLTPRSRQNALNAYEAAQRKQLEDFEAHKSKENSRIDEEIEKVRAHYAQCIQANLDQVAREKEAQSNGQNAMQGDSLRIGEVIGRCATQPAPPKVNSLAAAAGAQAAGEKSTSALKGPLKLRRPFQPRNVMSLLTAWLLSCGKRPAASSRVRHRVC